MHVYSTSAMHPISDSVPTFVSVAQHFQKADDAQGKGEFAPGTCRAYPHGTRDTAIAWPKTLPIYLASFRPIGSSSWPAAPIKHDNAQKGCKYVARARRVHLAPRRHYEGSIL